MVYKAVVISEEEVKVSEKGTRWRKVIVEDNKGNCSETIAFGDNADNSVFGETVYVEAYKGKDEKWHSQIKIVGDVRERKGVHENGRVNH